MTGNSGFDKSKNDTPPLSITYTNLLSLYCEQLVKNEKSHQDIKNAGTAIRSWQRALMLETQSRVSDEFGSSFDQFLQKYIAYERHRLKGKSTYPSRVSIIKSIRNFFLRLITSHSLPAAFSERLKFLLKLNNYNIRKFHQLFLKDLTSYQTIWYWAAGISMPRPDGLIVVEKIEQYLQVPKERSAQH